MTATLFAVVGLLSFATDEIYVVDAEGGVPRPLTREVSSGNVPTFSRDGRFIYFSSGRSGRPEIWRMAADGGPAVQVTQRGGTFAQESWDGRYLYVYYSSSAGAGIWRVPVGGGDEVKLHQLPSRGVSWCSWAQSRKGIYYTTWRWLFNLRRTESGLYFLEFNSGRVSELLRREGPFFRTH